MLPQDHLRAHEEEDQRLTEYQLPASERQDEEREDHIVIQSLEGAENGDKSPAEPWNTDFLTQVDNDGVDEGANEASNRIKDVDNQRTNDNQMSVEVLDENKVVSYGDDDHQESTTDTDVGVDDRFVKTAVYTDEHGLQFDIAVGDSDEDNKDDVKVVGVTEQEQFDVQEDGQDAGEAASGMVVRRIKNYWVICQTEGFF